MITYTNHCNLCFTIKSVVVLKFAGRTIIVPQNSVETSRKGFLQENVKMSTTIKNKTLREIELIKHSVLIFFFS